MLYVLVKNFKSLPCLNGSAYTILDKDGNTKNPVYRDLVPVEQGDRVIKDSMDHDSPFSFEGIVEYTVVDEDEEGYSYIAITIDGGAQ